MKRARTDTPTENVEDTQMDKQQDNPLLIDVIVQHLFEVIPFNCEDFKNWRLVSKLFWKSSLSTWRQNAWLSVNGRIYRSNNSCPYIEGYLDMLGATGDPYLLMEKFSFQKYKLEDWEFKFADGGRINRKKLEFWSKVGDKITHLRCSNSVFHKREDFQSVIFEFMPNLQFLSLENNAYKCGGRTRLPGEVFWNGFAVWEESIIPSPHEIRGNVSQVEISLAFKAERESEFPVRWSHFFVRFPNIKVLKLQNLHPSNPVWSNTEFVSLLDCVEMLRVKCGPHILAQLEELDILSVSLRATERLSPRLISHLCNLAFPLKSLALDIGFDDHRGEENLRVILETHSSTLQKLTVYRGPYVSRFPIECPVGIHLPHLTELWLIGNVFDSHLFLKQTPNLKTLVVMKGEEDSEGAMGLLKDYDEDFSLRYLHRKKVPQLGRITPPILLEHLDGDEPELEGIGCPKLEVFVLSGGRYTFDSFEVQELAKIMPNLQKLGVGIGMHSDGFEAVCRKWNNLEALYVDGFYINEDAVLGIEDGEKYRRPNLTDLTSLKYFGMGLDCFNKALSNDSILHGLLALPILEDLDIKLEPEVTEDVRLKLRSKFPHVKSQLGFDDDNSKDSSSKCGTDADID